MTDEQPLSRRAAREAAGASRKKSAKPAAATGAADAPNGTPDAPRNSGGIGAFFAKHPKAWLAGALGLAFALAGTGAVFAGMAVGSSASAEQLQALEPVADERIVPLDIAEASALRTCTISAAAADERLGTFMGSVINANTGEVLFDRAGTEAAPTASVMKVLIASAAMVTLGPDYRFTTNVYQGSEPGSIVLVGGGDPTLSATPIGQESYYKGAPKLATLAAAVKAEWNRLNPPVAQQPAPGPGTGPGTGDDDGEEEEEPSPAPPAAPVMVEQPITKIILDTSMWGTGDRWNPSWPAAEKRTGTAEVVALMVDGDRSEPTKFVSARSNDPAGRAGAKFASALGLNPKSVTITTGSAIPGKPLLGQVQSQPLSALLPVILQNSDNTVAEMLARTISAESNAGGSATSLTQVISGALASIGVKPAGITIADGSGLSPNNAVPPQFVAQLMDAILDGGNNLNHVYNALPVAGKNGTMAARFTGANEAARGAVHAKTGWIGAARTLAGIVHAADGTPLAFAFYAVGDVPASATDALDTVTTAVYHCGNNLSNI